MNSLKNDLDKKITNRSIYLAEIKNVKANRFLTAAEKETKINDLQQILN